ncbi:inosine-uridine nucleoside N-ribohydrolase [Streptomyces sp. DSM 42143]|uniref:hypothetical protein n=1 Tax=Streptomyces TaxID=1883 RepID=UPI000BCB968D|nr:MULTISPECIES: hypothetical protein [Streptomyces]MDQ0383341.1 inosine-uridine nucleoside N-ribohydrolase [Streptomyces sp. DSM 42143]PAK27922.1 hypothetical protein CJD44_01105 [Streptomyces sp. alain-838]
MAGPRRQCFDDLHTEPVRDDLDVADFLAETVRASPGEVDVMAIGLLANLARTSSATATSPKPWAPST